MKVGGIVSTKSELSTKNMVVVSKVGDYWVDDVQAARIRQILESGSKGMIELEGSYIALYAVEGVLSPTDYEVLNYRRRGAWQCKWKSWHEKFEKCAHGQYKNIR